MRTRAALRAACFAAAATSAFVVGAGSAGSSAGTPSCTMPALVVWLDTHGDHAAGSTYYKLRFTNVSGHACTLRGYPGIAAIGVGGRQLGRAAARDASAAVRLIRLANDATATATVRIVSVGNFPRSACRPATAAGLRVSPPGWTESRLVPFPFRACTRAGPVYLHVRAVQQHPA